MRTIAAIRPMRPRPTIPTSRATRPRRSTADTPAARLLTATKATTIRRARNRSSGLVTAVILIGCAMLGTAGAYGYRTYATSPSSKQAPVIIADTAPSKIVPSPSRNRRRSQDRVGAQGSDERLVSREEQPVACPAPRRFRGGVPVAGAAGADHHRLHAVAVGRASRPPSNRSGSAPSPSGPMAVTAAASRRPNEPPGAHRCAAAGAQDRAHRRRARSRDQPLSLDPNGARAGERSRLRPPPPQRHGDAAGAA